MPLRIRRTRATAAALAAGAVVLGLLPASAYGAAPAARTRGRPPTPGPRRGYTPHPGDWRPYVLAPAGHTVVPARVLSATARGGAIQGDPTAVLGGRGEARPAGQRRRPHPIPAAHPGLRQGRRRQDPHPCGRSVRDAAPTARLLQRVAAVRRHRAHRQQRRGRPGARLRHRQHLERLPGPALHLRLRQPHLHPRHRRAARHADRCAAPRRLPLRHALPRRARLGGPRRGVAGLRRGAAAGRHPPRTRAGSCPATTG